MAKSSVKILGVDRLLSKFDKLGKIDMTPAVNKATAVVQGSAKSIAPVDKGVLKGSISKETKRKMSGEVVGRVFTNIEYAPFVEFGTGAKGSGTYPYSIKGVSLEYRNTPWAFKNEDGDVIWTNGQVAQPFMFPALKQNEDAIKKMLQSEYTSLIAKVI